MKKIIALLITILNLQSPVSFSQIPVLIKDIYSGTTSSNSALYGIVLNGNYIFPAANSANGRELWITDASTGGTSLIKDINPGTSDSDPGYLMVFNGMVYFTADNGTNGRELWKTDGTSAGTQLVKDIGTGTNSGFEQWCCGGFAFTKVWEHNGSFFFIANNVFSNSYDNIELWKSDGTTAGTVMVSDIYPGNEGSRPSYFTEFNNTLYFTADNGTVGRELWKTDGTSGGTQLVKDIGTGTNSGFEQWCCGGFAFTKVWEHNGSFFFIANNVFTNSYDNIELWKSDGTTAGTVMVSDIYPGNQGSRPSYFTEFNNTLFFTADNGTVGRELWKTDGTSGGTQLVKDIGTGTNSGFEQWCCGGFAFTKVWEHNGSFFFVANNVFSNSYDNIELWKSDGTTAGTVMVSDIYPGNEGSMPSYFTEFNNTLFFTADDGTVGRELWKTDGTSGGTQLVKDIGSGTNSGFEQWCCGGFAFTKVWEHNGSFFFVANNIFSASYDNIELWKSDGTAAGTVMVKDINAGNSGSSPGYFTPFNNQLFFTASTPALGRELYITDGTTGGTQLVKDISPGTGDGVPYLYNIINYGSVFYFEADQLGSSDDELWKTDGTTAGTVKVLDIYAGTSGSYPGYFTLLPNDNLIFLATDVTHGTELWTLYLPGVTGIEEKVTDNNFTVYPNPVSGGIITLSAGDKMQGDYMVQILDINGRLLKTQLLTATPSTSIPVQLPPVKAGVYFIRLTDNKQFSQTRRIEVAY